MDSRRPAIVSSAHFLRRSPCAIARSFRALALLALLVAAACPRPASAGPTQSENRTLSLRGRRVLLRQIAQSQAQQVHVSLAGVGRVLVWWVTSGNTPASVEYGESRGKYTKTASGSVSRYSLNGYTSGYIHKVLLGRPMKDGVLKPGTTYYYRMGGAGPTRAFKTPPPSSHPISVALVADMDSTPAAAATISRLSRTPHALVVFPGDLAYANGYQPEWDTWQSLIQPAASLRPWMTGAGNHEDEADEGAPSSNPFKAYNARWPMPAAASGSSSNLFYSFDSGSIHWVVLSCYSDYSQGSAQYNWLQNVGVVYMCLLLPVGHRRTSSTRLTVADYTGSRCPATPTTPSEAMRLALEQTPYYARAGDCAVHCSSFLIAPAPPSSQPPSPPPPPLCFAFPPGPPSHLQADLAKVDRKVTPWLMAAFHEPWYHSNKDHQLSAPLPSTPPFNLQADLAKVDRKADLAKVDRKVTPWLIAAFHEPWYHSNKDHQKSGEDMRLALEKLLYDGHTDVVVCGHVHAYERTLPLYNNAQDPCGMVHLTVGTGGADLYTSFLSPKPAWSAFRQAAYGFGVLSVGGGASKGEAVWRWRRNSDAAGVVADEASIISHASSKAPAQCRA
ncbi:unnamed protein product [Closterium sp. Naga37s-1]|nr:unnamed protein product [Closterium sp. Naga37s-1]